MKRGRGGNSRCIRLVLSETGFSAHKAHHDRWFWCFDAKTCWLTFSQQIISFGCLCSSSPLIHCATTTQLWLKLWCGLQLLMRFPRSVAFYPAKNTWIELLRSETNHPHICTDQHNLTNLTRVITSHHPKSSPKSSSSGPILQPTACVPE